MGNEPVVMKSLEDFIKEITNTLTSVPAETATVQVLISGYPETYEDLNDEDELFEANLWCDLSFDTRLQMLGNSLETLLSEDAPALESAFESGGTEAEALQESSTKSFTSAVRGIRDNLESFADDINVSTLVKGHVRNLFQTLLANKMRNAWAIAEKAFSIPNRTENLRDIIEEVKWELFSNVKGGNATPKMPIVTPKDKAKAPAKAPAKAEPADTPTTEEAEEKTK